VDALQAFGLELIRALQALSPALDGVMHAFTFMGKIEFYLLILPLIYWAVDHRLGFRLLLVLITLDLATATFKLLLHQPRPYWLGGVQALAEETTYGLPSAHASESLAVWGYLAYRLRRRWLSVVVAAFVVLIGVSRVYLAVHFPHDVVAGWLLGAALLWAFVAGERPLTDRAGRQTAAIQIALGLALALVVLLIGQGVQAALSGRSDPAAWSALAARARTPAYSFTLAGALFGAVSGYALMRRYAPFESGGVWLRRAARYSLGILGVLGLYFGLDALFGLIAADETAAGYGLRFVRYAAATFWVTGLAPWLFLRLRLADAPATSATGRG